VARKEGKSKEILMKEVEIEERYEKMRNEKKEKGRKY
jgi:hypothetical protein